MELQRGQRVAITAVLLLVLAAVASVIYQWREQAEATHSVAGNATAPAADTLTLAAQNYRDNEGPRHRGTIFAQLVTEIDAERTSGKQFTVADLLNLLGTADHWNTKAAGGGSVAYLFDRIHTKDASVQFDFDAGGLVTAVTFDQTTMVEFSNWNEQPFGAAATTAPATAPIPGAF